MLVMQREDLSPILRKHLLESGKLLVSKIHSESMIYGIASLSILFNSGNATLYDVQHLLEHQSPQTSTRYAHLSSNRLREVSANVAELVGEVTNLKKRI